MSEMDNKAELLRLLNGQRRQSVIYSGLTILSMVVAAYFVFQLWDTRQELVAKTKELDASLTEKEMAIEQLELMQDSVVKTVNQLTTLKAVSDSLKDVATLQIQAMALGTRPKGVMAPGSVASSGKQAPMNQKKEMLNLARNMTNSSFLISVHSIGVDKREIELTIESLRSNGYYAEACNSFKAGAAPKWMAKVPTVFYYSASSKEQADYMASILEKSIGVPFDVERGSGFGVMKGQERNTFFIHLVGRESAKR